MEKTMYSYIMEEETVCKNILADRKSKLEPFIKLIGKNINSIDRIIFLATGSSANAFNCAKYYMEKLLKIEVEIKMPGAFYNYDKFFDGRNIFIGISQGGKSTSTINAIKKVKDNGIENVLIVTGDIKSPICKYSNDIVDINCGEEKVGYVTKGFTATVLTLMLMGLEGAYSTGRITKYDYENELQKFVNLVNQIPTCIAKANEWYENNKKDFVMANRVKVIGYGPGYGVALESNTKITETVRIPVSAFELEEYMHGPYLELKNDHYMFLLKTNGVEKARLTKLEEYSRKTTEYCYTITYEKESSDTKTLVLDYIGDEDISTILFVIPIQILSYKMAENKEIPLGIKIFTDFHAELLSKRKE